MLSSPYKPIPPTNSCMEPKNGADARFIVDDMPSVKSCGIKVLTTLQELMEFRSVWESLEHHPNVNLDLYEAYQKCNANAIRPHVIAILRGEKVESFLLGRLDKTDILFQVAYLKLYRIKVPSLIVMHEGFIGEMTEETAQAAAESLLNELKKGEVDRLYFNHWKKNSPLVDAVIRKARPSQRSFFVSEAVHRAMVLPKYPGEFLARMRSKHRSWIKRKIRDLEQAYPGTVEYKWVNSYGPDLAMAMEDTEKVASRTYQRGLGAGFRNDALHQLRFESEAKTGRLRMLLLYAGGKPRAFWIGFVYGQTFHSAFTGYDPDLRDHELGTLVFVHLIDRLCEEGVNRFDFGLGDAFYKERFADESGKDVIFSIWRPVLKGLSLNIALSATLALDARLKLMIQKAGLLNRIKSIWRKRL